jgi:helix-turn-helix protein
VIAFAWGFSDLSHFGRRFKAEFGCSPGEYRKRPNSAQTAVLVVKGSAKVADQISWKVGRILTARIRPAEFPKRLHVGTNVLATSLRLKTGASGNKPMDESKRAGNGAARNFERANRLVSDLQALITMVREQTSRSRDAISRIDSTDRREKPMEPPVSRGLLPR